MKPTHFTSLVALFVFSAGWGLTDSLAQAQTKATTAVHTKSYEITYYQIQVEYARTRDYGYGGRGGYGGYPYAYSWLTIAESSDLAEAEFIYDLFQLAADLGVLNEVAPDLGRGIFPTRVRMMTYYRTVPLANTATLR